MVLESIVSPAEAIRKPHELLIAGALFVTFGVFVQLALPSIHGSAIVFAMVPAIPLAWALLVREERCEEDRYKHVSPLLGVRAELSKPASFLAQHGRLIEVFAFLFLGALAAYAFWFAILPSESNELVFGDQLREVELIRGYADSLGAQGGEGVIVSGRVFHPGRFTALFSHNLQLLAIMFLFCLVYGIGSVYLLLWNASVIGVVLGQRIKIEGVGGAVTGFFSLLPHGIFEVAAYFVASISGGILSVAVMRFRYCKHELPELLTDVAVLAVLSIILLAFGALVESVY